MTNKEMFKCLERMVKSQKPATQKQSQAIDGLMEHYNRCAPTGGLNAYMFCRCDVSRQVSMEVKGTRGSITNMLVNIMNSEPHFYRLFSEAISHYEKIAT